MAFFYGQILVQVANEITEPLLLPIFIALYGRRRHDHSVDTEAGINGLIRKVIISGGDVRRSKAWVSNYDIKAERNRSDSYPGYQSFASSLINMENQMNKLSFTMIALCAISSSAVAAEAKGPAESPTKISFSGRAQVELAQQDNGTTSNFRLDDTNLGRAGFKVTHDLGDGMTALAGAEWKIDFSDNNVNTAASEMPFSQRESYIGLKGGWGTIQAGNLPSPYKMTGGVKYDALVTTLLEARNNGGMSGGAYGHNSFISKTVAYHSPKVLGGLMASVQYRPDTLDAGSRGSDDDTSLSVSYAKPTWEAFVASVSQTSAHTDRTKLGGKLMLGNHALLAQYEKTDAKVDSTTYFLGYNLKISKTTLVIQGGRTDVDTGNDSDYLAVGAIHNLSKKFRLFGGYRNTESGTSDVDVISVGMRMDFNS